MPIKQTVPTNSGDYLQFGNATTPVAAQVGGYEDSTGNGHLELYTTAGGTVTEQVRVTSAGEWIQTSYNTHGNQHPENRPLRGNYAGIGFTYDKTNDVFYAPKPYPSWILNKSTWLWEAPIAMPTDGLYQWDEATTSWIEVTNAN